MKATIDTQRLTNFVTKQEQRLLEIQKFTTDRLNSLNLLIPTLESIVKKHSGTDLTVGNMYSTHIDDTAYTDAAKLIVCCSFTLTKQIKNERLFITKVVQSLKENQISTDRVYIPIDGVVKFQIWVK